MNKEHQQPTGHQTVDHNAAWYHRLAQHSDTAETQ